MENINPETNVPSSSSSSASPSKSADHPHVSVAGRGVQELQTIKARKPIAIFIAPHFTDALESARETIKHRRLLYPQLSKQYHPPPYHALNLVKVIFHLLGYKAEQLGNPEAANPSKFSWFYARRLFTIDFVNQLLAYDPGLDDSEVNENADESLPSYMRIEGLKNTMDNILDKEVMEQGPAFKGFLKWAKVAVDIRYSAVEQRQRTCILRNAGLA